MYLYQSGLQLKIMLVVEQSANFPSISQLASDYFNNSHGAVGKPVLVFSPHLLKSAHSAVSFHRKFK